MKQPITAYARCIHIQNGRRLTFERLESRALLSISPPQIGAFSVDQRFLTPDSRLSLTANDVIPADGMTITDVTFTAINADGTAKALGTAQNLSQDRDQTTFQLAIGGSDLAVGSNTISAQATQGDGQLSPSVTAQVTVVLLQMTGLTAAGNIDAGIATQFPNSFVVVAGTTGVNLLNLETAGLNGGTLDLTESVPNVVTLSTIGGFPQTLALPASVDVSNAGQSLLGNAVNSVLTLNVVPNNGGVQAADEQLELTYTSADGLWTTRETFHVMVVPPGFTFLGTISYLMPDGDYPLGVGTPPAIPLRGIQVNITEHLTNGQDETLTGYTDMMGAYAIFDPRAAIAISSCDVTIVAQSEGRAYFVTLLGFYDPVSVSVRESVVPHLGINPVSTVFTPSDPLKDPIIMALNIFNAMTTGYTVATRLSTPFSQHHVRIGVYYGGPSGSSHADLDMATSHEYKISIQDVWATPQVDYRLTLWDTVLHEFGHVFAFDVGIPVYAKGIEHDPTIGNLRGAGPLTEEHAALAWSEGWAHFYSVIAQRLDGVDRFGLRTVGDTSIYAYNLADPMLRPEPHFQSAGVQTPWLLSTDVIGGGEDHELSVARVLFQVLQLRSDGFRTASVIDQSIADLIGASRGSTNLNQFWAKLTGSLDEGVPADLEKKIALAKIFEANGITANGLHVDRSLAVPGSATIIFRFRMPKAEWRVPLPTSWFGSQFGPKPGDFAGMPLLDRYVLRFFDENHKPLLSIPFDPKALTPDEYIQTVARETYAGVNGTVDYGEYIPTSAAWVQLFRYVDSNGVTRGRPRVYWVVSGANSGSGGSYVAGTEFWSGEQVADNLALVAVNVVPTAFYGNGESLTIKYRIDALAPYQSNPTSYPVVHPFTIDIDGLNNLGQTARPLFTKRVSRPQDRTLGSHTIIVPTVLGGDFRVLQGSLSNCRRKLG